ncbi:MAG: uracil phosphoribosyltransferase [Calditrichaeota bacterium]|nr:uracil phosphoribosyltransferase [Calditrichota bacterium]
MQSFPNLTVVEHAIIQDKLARLRDKATPFFDFRTLLEDISLLLFYEASRKLSTRDETIETPLESMTVRRLQHPILLVPILRAGLGMANGIVKVFPEARIGVLGMYRDETTLQPVDYYLRLPDDIRGMDVFLLDPMLATGGSAHSAVEKLKRHRAERIVMLAVIAAPEGVSVMQEHHPEVPIFTAALDRQLNSRGFILPGLGDAGDRYFGV